MSCRVQTCLCLPSVMMGSIFKKSIFISALMAEKCKFLDNVKSGEIMISEHYNICPPTRLRLPTNISAPAYPHNSLRLTKSLLLPPALQLLPTPIP